MGVSRTTGEFGGKIRRLERNIGELGERKAIVPVATAVQVELVRSAAAAGLHPGSKIAGRPWKGVYVRPRGPKELGVGYAPPAHLVNSRTRAHLVGARARLIATRKQAIGLINLLAGGHAVRNRGRITGGAKALHWGNNFAAYVRSPGTRGKRFFERARPAAQRQGAAAVHRQMTAAVTDVFR